MTTSPLATPEAWNLVAAAYTAELLPSFELFSRDALGLTPLPAGATVLDVATGPGTLAMMAAAAGAKVTALDFSPEMLAQLAARAAAAGLSIATAAGDGQALPFADGQFDAAFSMFGLIFFPDREAGFRQLLRILRPGGRATVASWAPFEGPFSAALERLRAHLPGLPFGVNRAPLGDAGEVSTEMRAAGFATVEVHTRTHLLPQPSLAAFWDSTQRTIAPMVLLRRQLGEARWRELAAAVYTDLEREFGPGPVEERATALIGIGTKPAA